MGALGGGKHSLFFTLLVKKKKKKLCVWAAEMQLFVFPRVHRADLWLFKPRAALNQDSAQITNGLDISYVLCDVGKKKHLLPVVGTKLLFSKGKEV